MNLSEVKEIVLAQCKREKRITVRNIVIIAALAFVILTLIYKYALPMVFAYADGVQTEVASGPNGQYIKWALIAAVCLTILYPAMALYKVFKRAQNASLAFDHIGNGQRCKIIGEQTRYLTTIPIYRLRLKLNPVHYLAVTVNNKAYDLPITESLSPQIKTALSGADAEKAIAILQQLYEGKNQPEINEASQPVPALESFTSFADEAFTEDLKYIEGSRKTSKNMFVVQIIFAVAFVGTMMYVSMINPALMSHGESVLKLIGGVVGIAVLLSVLFIVILKIKNKGNSRFADFTDFKNSIFSRMVAFANPHFEYIEKGHIGKQHLLHSGLIIDQDYHITGGDQIIGIHNGVPFQSCNLRVTHRPQLRRENVPDNEVFAGNYFVARFNKSFRYPIYIHPKKGLFGIIKDNEIAQYLDGSRHKITLEDPEFEKQFTVYCDDDIIARYVLTPAMMQRIKDINTRSKGNLHIAINDKNIVLANNTNNALVEMDGPVGALFTKIDKPLLQKLYEELIADLSMIDVMKLNQNIWR